MGNVYVGNQGQPVQYNNPPPKKIKANPGPPSRGSYSGTKSGGNGATHAPPQPPPDIFAGYLGPEIDAAKQIVQQWLSLMGYPHGLDANTLTLDILQQGLTADSMSADRWLSDNVSDQASRDAHPWAQFGLDASSYQQRKDGIDSLFQAMMGRTPDWLGTLGEFAQGSADITGPWGTSGSLAIASQAGSKIGGIMGPDQDLPGLRQDLQNIYYKALRGNWNQTQLLQALTGSSSASIQQLIKQQPWLAQGQTYQQASQTYASLYGSAPVDTKTLSAWFKFNTGASTLSRTQREAVESAAPLGLVGAGTMTR